MCTFEDTMLFLEKRECLNKKMIIFIGLNALWICRFFDRIMVGVSFAFKEF